METILDKKIFVSFMIFACLYCLPELAIAQKNSIHARLKIVQMVCLKQTEHGKDEVYFEIKTINKQSKHKVFRVPSLYPLTLPVSEGFKIQNVTLLEQKLPPGESITLVISLLESDLSNFNPDDLIGAALVNIRNNNGQMEAQWHIPKTKYNVYTKMTKLKNQSEFSMFGDGGNYKLIFEVIPVKKNK